MRHCCEFEAYDIWYLKDTDEFSNRVLYFGTCPICNKYVAKLVQRRIKTNIYLTIKKVGDSALAYMKTCCKEKIFSRNEVNKMKLKPKPYGWRYGVNKEITKKDGGKTLRQYAKDFLGNTELIKEI